MCLSCNVFDVLSPTSEVQVFFVQAGSFLLGAIFEVAGDAAGDDYDYPHNLASVLDRMGVQ